MLSSVTSYIFWLLDTAIPAFMSSEPLLIFTSLMCLTVVLGYVVRLIRPPKI